MNVWTRNPIKSHPMHFELPTTIRVKILTRKIWIQGQILALMINISVVDPFHFDLDSDPDPGRILTKNQGFEIS